MLSTSSIGRQMKAASCDISVSKEAKEEMLYIVNNTLCSMAVTVCSNVKAGKSCEFSQLDIPELKTCSDLTVPKSQIVRKVKDVMAQCGLPNYKFKQNDKEWLTQYINNYIYYVGVYSANEAIKVNKKTIKGVHVKLGHREMLLPCVWKNINYS